MTSIGGPIADSPGSDAAWPRAVLILTNERDFAADLVVDQLQGLDVHVTRCHLMNDAGAPTLEVLWDPDDGPHSDRFSAVWLRQFLPEMKKQLNVADVDDQLVAREQWRAWLSDLAESDRPRWMNPLWASRRAENKLLQLREATRVGLRVPRTKVTNSRTVAVTHQRDVGPCIVKSVASAYHAFSDGSFMFTRPLADALTSSESEWSAQPLIVQERITPRIDVRVFVVGDYVSAAGSSVGGIDWRTRAGDAEWTMFDVPDATRRACVALVRRLGLVYGALDFAFDGDTMWFLECNQAGEFGFVDRPLNLGVARSIAKWLAQ